MSTKSKRSYESWLAELVSIAKEQKLEWLVSAESPTHRAAFDKGLTPDEELNELQNMFEWRGCGCGG